MALPLVLFIYPNVHTHYSFSPAIQILSAVLKREGYRTDLIHINDEHGVPFRKDIIVQLVKEKKPDLIGFTATTFEFKVADEIAGMLKEAGITVPIILGGIHATISPEGLWESNFDGFCISEGDLPMLDLMDRIKHHQPFYDTKSFWFKIVKPEGITQIRNDLAPYMADLNDLPFHDFDIIDAPKLLAQRAGWLSISFSRGCPYNCSFCINPLLRRINGVTSSTMKCYLRKRKVQSVLEELQYLISKYGDHIKVFNLDDDLIAIDRKWMKEFCVVYQNTIWRRLGIGYTINCRVDLLTDEIADMWSRSGCIEVKIGVESGDDYIRNTVMHKEVTRDHIINAFHLIHKYRLRSCAYFILGLPTETEQTIKSTMDLIWQIRPTLIRMTFLQPYIGTEIYEYCKKHNLYGTHRPTDSFTESPLHLPTISDTKLLFYKLLMPWHLNAYVNPIYQEALKKYEPLPYDKLVESIPQIIKEDAELSAKMSEYHLSHFRYFNKNEYYYEYKEFLE